MRRCSSFGVPSLGELTPSAERRSLSLAVEPAAIHAPTDLAEIVLALYLAPKLKLFLQGYQDHEKTYHRPKD